MNDVELVEADLKAPEYAVTGMCPEGLVILAAEPKAGKSFTAMDIAGGVASGTQVLGFACPKPRDVLYLALEDSAYRVQKRWRAYMARTGITPTGMIEFEHEWSLAQEGGLSDLERYLKDFPNLGLVVIDTLDYFQDTVGGYSEIRAKFKPISQLGKKYHVSILCIHHANRGTKVGMDRNPLEAIQGSFTGIVGTADALMVLMRDRKEPNKGVLYLTGKDVETTNIPLTWRQSGGWERAGLKHEKAMEQLNLKRAIIDYLRECPESDVRSIAEGVNSTWQNIRLLLWTLADDGKVVRGEDGRYSLPEGEGGPAPTSPGTGAPAASPTAEELVNARAKPAAWKTVTLVGEKGGNTRTITT